MNQNNRENFKDMCFIFIFNKDNKVKLQKFNVMFIISLGDCHITKLEALKKDILNQNISELFNK